MITGSRPVLPLGLEPILTPWGILPVDFSCEDASGWGRGANSQAGVAWTPPHPDPQLQHRAAPRESLGKAVALPWALQHAKAWGDQRCPGHSELRDDTMQSHFGYVTKASWLWGS